MVLKNFFDGLRHPAEGLKAANLAYKYQARMEAEKWHQAVPIIREYLKIVPGDDSTWSDLGNVLTELGRDEEALECYKKAIKFSPENLEHWYNKAETLADLEKYDDAITAYRKSIRYSKGEDSEDIKDSWYGIAWVSGLQKNYKGALVAIDAALDIDKDDYAFWHLKLILLLQNKKYKECLKACLKAFKLDPEDPYSHFHEAEAHLGLGDLIQANSAVTLAIKLDKNNADAYEVKAKILLEQDKKNDALKSIDKAIETDTDSPSFVFYTKAMILSSMGNQEDALDALMVATAINPDPGKEIKNDLKSSRHFKNIRNLQKFKKLVSKLS